MNIYNVHENCERQKASQKISSGRLKLPSSHFASTDRIGHMQPDTQPQTLLAFINRLFHFRWQ